MFFQIVDNLQEELDSVNNRLSMIMFQKNMKYRDICARSDASADEFMRLLYPKWTSVFQNVNTPCPITNIAEVIDSTTLKNQLQFLSTLDVSNLSTKQLEMLVQTNPQVASKLMKSFHAHALSEDPQQFIFDILHRLSSLAACRGNEVILTVSQLYIDKYTDTVNKNSEKLSAMINNVDAYMHRLMRRNSTLPNLSKSIANELNALIPSHLGNMKKFLVAVISTYYQQIHPIVSAQIFCACLKAFRKELPSTPQNANSLFYRTILLNSGPVVLKLLQKIVSVLPDDMKITYGLQTLRYPLLKSTTVDDIMSEILVEPQYCKRTADFSASVGHVRMYRYTNYTPETHEHREFMVKLIKPVTGALTSCWEYSLLNTIYAVDTVENRNIRIMLEGIGSEFDLAKEARNMQKGYEKYTCTYRDSFHVDIDMSLTATRPLNDILREGVWQAVAMEVAKGIPLSEIVENKEKYLIGDQLHASLYRGLDLLVQRWFFSIIGCGFYHCDLHAGNIFFSYEDRRMTVIDWGAIGYVNLFGRESVMKMMRKVIAASMYSNFCNVFEYITEELNKDEEEVIDVTSSDYKKFNKRLEDYQKETKLLSPSQKVDDKQLYEDIFGDKRIESEWKAKSDVTTESISNNDSIYMYYDAEEDVVTESRPEPTKLLMEQQKKKQGVAFSDVLNEIIFFYTVHDVNIQEKFPELIEFQKGYAMLLGTLFQLDYHPYRFKLALEKAIYRWEHWHRLVNLDVIFQFLVNMNVEKGKSK